MSAESKYLRAPLWSLFFLLALPSFAQEKTSFPFYKGETITYELTYQWGLIWADAGVATFTVGDTIVNNERYWRFSGLGVSYPKWNWFYKVNSLYESYASEDLTSQRFVRKGYEGSNIYDRDYHVKEDSIYYRIQDGEDFARHGVMERKAAALDVVTAIYYCRSIDFNQYAVGDKIPLLFYLDGNYYESYLRYSGIEMWEDPETDEEIECIVFKPNLIKGTIFKEGERMEVYVTNDDRKIPVYIETDLKVGKAKIHLIGGR
ncbi:MAG: DUF3108 domain-containing protein [Flavobacteriales bacterium]|nr:DUF3108 domain-containing protein [Flavobacteriales bacterium]